MSELEAFTRRRLTVVLLVIAAIMAVVALERALTWRSRMEAQSQQQKAVESASAEVGRLISVSAKGAHAALGDLLAGAAGSFRSDLEKNAKSLQQALAANDVVATGSIVAAGIGQHTDDEATVFVAAQGTVSNTGSGVPQTRTYRVKLTMQRVNGHWLVAGLVFVS